jgi:Yip1 domain
MDTEPPPLPAESQPTREYSLGGLLADVYAAPCDAFDYVKTAPVRAVNWIVPLILSVAMALVFVLVAYAQPAVLRGMRDAQEKAFQKNVAAGKMTQAQADQAQKAVERFMTPTVLKLIGVIFASFGAVAAFFFIALVLWLIVHFGHHSPVGYMKVLEVLALAGIIGILQTAVRVILVIWKGSLLVTFSPNLLLPDLDAHKKKTLWLGLLDPIEIWWLSILTLGLSKVASIPFAKSALWVFGLWYAFRVVAILLTPA